MGQDLIQSGAVRPPQLCLSDTILKSQSALVAGGLSQRGARGRAGCAGGCRADPCFTRPPRRDLWALICCCQPPLICEQAGMSLGERLGGGQRGAAKEGFTAPLSLKGWVRICSSAIAAGLVIREEGKLMAALKRALEELWGCWGFFNSLQVEILRKGRLWGRSSLCLWQSGDRNVMRMFCYLFVLETIQEPFFLEN